MRRDSCRRYGPPWWPADEKWPPHSGRFHRDRHARARFFRRIAVAVAGVILVAALAILAVAWMLAERFGLAGPWAPTAALVLLFAGVMALTMIFGALRRVASPLGSVMEAADRVADGDYSARVEELGPPPIRALARSFNTMTERLQNADRLRRDLMADVAHELRTPLSVLQGRLEGLLDGVYPRDDRHITEVLGETHVLSRLIDDLRTLALADAGALPLQKESTRLVALVRDVVHSMEATAAGKSLTLNVSAPADDLVVSIDPVRIREVLTNLLSNAFCHSSAGARVTVSVETSDERARVTVSDVGEGMSPQQVARIFDRFYKGTESRGSGLGLTIAKGIVTSHGGEISASSQPGKGSAITFTLPRS